MVVRGSHIAAVFVGVVCGGGCCVLVYVCLGVDGDAVVCCLL